MTSTPAFPPSGATVPGRFGRVETFMAGPGSLDVRAVEPLVPGSPTRVFGVWAVATGGVTVDERSPDDGEETPGLAPPNDEITNTADRPVATMSPGLT